MKYVISDWKTAVLVQIYEKGDPMEPESFRPKALVSHVRKAIESAVAIAIRLQYTSSQDQLGF